MLLRFRHVVLTCNGVKAYQTIAESGSIQEKWMHKIFTSSNRYPRPKFLATSRSSPICYASEVRFYLIYYSTIITLDNCVNLVNHTVVISYHLILTSSLTHWPYQHQNFQHLTDEKIFRCFHKLFSNRVKGWKWQFPTSQIFLLHHKWRDFTIWGDVEIADWNDIFCSFLW